MEISLINKLPCGCNGHPRPAMEHNKECKCRLTFFGAPAEWGVGSMNEIRYVDNMFFIYKHTWEPIFLTDAEKIRYKRKKKIEEIWRWLK